MHLYYIRKYFNGCLDVVGCYEDIWLKSWGFWMETGPFWQGMDDFNIHIALQYFFFYNTTILLILYHF